MQLVIDISEEDYNFLTKQVADGITNPLKICIANGTPLPKGHGRLIDAGVFVLNVIKYSHQSTKTIGQALSDTPTIIEADKGESEDKK